jgi:small subunit ribosomal protein S16
MVTIRLSRGGAKKRPFYHIVATQKQSPRDGRYIERLGYFNPIAKGQQRRVFMDLSRIEYWISTGAQTSNRVASLIKEAQKLPPELLQPEHQVRKVVVKAPPKPMEEVVEKPKAAAKKHAPKKASDKDGGRKPGKGAGAKPSKHAPGKKVAAKKEEGK